MPQSNLDVIYKKSKTNQYEIDFFINNNIEKNIVSFSFRNEIKQAFKFASIMIWAFPSALIMRWHIRRNKKLKYILQFPELVSIRNNIEKGSFAYDSLLFKENIFQILQNKTHLANLVCLAILFGDEFIDGIAAEHGKKNIQKILDCPTFNYYLQLKTNQNKVELFYEFDICTVLPTDVLNTVNKKYEITYLAFYKHLLFLLEEINKHLNKLEITTKQEVGLLICKVCNTCFDTYKNDISFFTNDYSFDDLQLYQQTKDDDIIYVLLTIRACLLKKKNLLYVSKFSGWSSVVRSMQLYDDLLDAPFDHNYQMNTILFFAKNYFQNEWNWFLENVDDLKNKHELNLQTYLCLFMPGSVLFTLQYAQQISINKLDWTQRKILNYLWRKNWLGFNNKLLQNQTQLLDVIFNKKNMSIPLKLHLIKSQINLCNHEFITESLKKSLCINVVLMHDDLKEYLYNKITFKEKYFLNSSFIELPLTFKCTLYDKIFTDSF